MVDKNLSVEQQLGEIVKRLKQNNADNRKLYYSWIKKSSEHIRDSLKKVVADKISAEDVDKIFKDAEQYNLEELVENQYDFVAMSKEELEPILDLLMIAFDEVESFEPDESEIYGFDYESVYEAWEDIQSILENKIRELKEFLKV